MGQTVQVPLTTDLCMKKVKRDKRDASISQKVRRAFLESRLTEVKTMFLSFEIKFLSLKLVYSTLIQDAFTFNH